MSQASINLRKRDIFLILCHLYLFINFNSSLIILFVLSNLLLLLRTQYTSKILNMKKTTDKQR